jgi:hypothetical protein
MEGVRGIFQHSPVSLLVIAWRKASKGRAEFVSMVRIMMDSTMLALNVVYTVLAQVLFQLSLQWLGY